MTGFLGYWPLAQAKRDCRVGFRNEEGEMETCCVSISPDFGATEGDAQREARDDQLAIKDRSGFRAGYLGTLLMVFTICETIW
jgi:hypothetical protein